jgi:hypothetical protein
LLAIVPAIFVVHGRSLRRTRVRGAGEGGPGKLNYGSAGNGSASHLAMNTRQATGIEISTCHTRHRRTSSTWGRASGLWPAADAAREERQAARITVGTSARCPPCPTWARLPQMYPLRDLMVGLSAGKNARGSSSPPPKPAISEEPGGAGAPGGGSTE